MLNANSKKFKAKVQEYFNKHRVEEFDANGDDIVKEYRAYTKNGALQRQVNWVGLFMAWPFADFCTAEQERLLDEWHEGPYCEKHRLDGVDLARNFYATIYTHAVQPYLKERGLI